jgi:hypothetical protein
MVSIEEHVQQIVEANWGDKNALIYRIANEIRLLRTALPAPAYLESVASQMEMASDSGVKLVDGTTFDGPVFLRHAALLVRLAINEQSASENARVDAHG